MRTDLLLRNSGKISTKCRIYDIFKKCKYRERNTFGGTLEWD